jgi:hypothetical protein
MELEVVLGEVQRTEIWSKDGADVMTGKTV